MSVVALAPSHAFDREVLRWNRTDWTSEERLLAEQAVLNLRSLNETCDDAADGTVLAIAEKLAVEQGCELTRRTLQTVVNRRKGSTNGAACASAKTRFVTSLKHTVRR